MTPPPVFEPTDFIGLVGQQLVLEFERAGMSGTPTLIGDSRESPARDALGNLLPGFAAVGSGIVISGDRLQSKQQDVVIYERDLSPLFSINGVASSTYHPVEGVMAVGEVKSSLGQAELEDAFRKIESVKRLRRHSVPTDDMGLGTPYAAYRHFGSSGSFAAVAGDQYDQTNKELDQVFGFVLCKRFDLKPETVLERAEALWSRSSHAEAPNCIVSLADGIIAPSADGRLLTSPLGATSVSLIADAPLAFLELVRLINRVVRRGRTVPVDAYTRYLIHPSTSTPSQALIRPLSKVP
jgi:hypothetical protein